MVKQVMRSVGSLLQPMGNTPHSAAGLPARSTEHPRPDLTPQESQYYTAFREAVHNYYTQKYVAEPGWDHYPAPLQKPLADFGINAGESRARCALVKAMREAGVINETQYDAYPQITSAQMIDRASFQPGGSGYAYAERATNKQILNDLASASPEQLQQTNARFVAWRDIYYTTLAKHDPAFKQYLDGWRNRSRKEFLSAADAVGASVEQQQEVPVTKQTALLYAEYRFNGIGHAIALEIPGHGIVQYDVDVPSATFKKFNTAALPPGVKLLPADQLQVQWYKSDEVLNPYPLDNTLTWLDAKGERQFLPLTKELNTSIVSADTTYYDAPVVTRATDPKQWQVNGYTVVTKKDFIPIIRPTFDIHDGMLPADNKVRLYNHGRSYAVQDVDQHQPPAPTPFANPSSTLTK